MRRLLLAATAITALFAAAPAKAGLLTFDDLGGSQGDPNPFLPSPFAYGGFTFSSSYLFLNTDPSACFGGCAGDGTPYLSSADGPALIVMAPVGGSTFTLASFASALPFLGAANSASNPDQVGVTGQQAGGGTVQASFDLSTAFSTSILPNGFTGLTSVAFQGVFQPGETTMQQALNALALDDIRTADTPLPPSSVPEPASALMLGAGLLGFALRRALS
jgi:hypothetical protein